MNNGYTYELSERDICRNLYQEIVKLAGAGEAINAMIRSVDEGSIFETRRKLSAELSAYRAMNAAAESDEADDSDEECTCNPDPNREGMACPACRAMAQETSIETIF